MPFSPVDSPLAPSPAERSATAGAQAIPLTVWLCASITLCEGIDLQAAGIAAAGLHEAFAPTAQMLGSFFSASTLGLFVGALLGGRLSDSHGRKAVLVASVALFGLFSVLNSLAWDMRSLYWLRLLTGVGLGGVLPNVLALAREASAAHRGQANVALAYSGTPIGGAIISLISMEIAPTQWRLIFIVGGVIPLLLVPLLVRHLRESEASQLARAQRRMSSEQLPRSVARIVGEGRWFRTMLLWLSFFFGLLTLYLLLNWLPTLMAGDGLSKNAAAATQIGFNIGGALAAWGIGHLLESSIRTPSVVATFLLLPVLLYVLAMLHGPVDLIVLVAFALGSAVLAAQAFLYAMAPAFYPTAVRGLGVGLAVAAGRIGSIVGPQLGGAWKAQGLSSSGLLLKLLPIVIAGSVTAIWIALLRRPVDSE